MPDDLVDDVGLRTVVGALRVSDVLGRAEVFGGERIQELPLVHESCDRFDPKAALLGEVLRQLLELRDPLRHPKGFFHVLHLVVVSLAHRCFV